MPVPTISLVTPNRGPATGGSIVRITGTNFRVPPEPERTVWGPMAPKPVTVAVSFGGVPSPRAGVGSEQALFVELPKFSLVAANGRALPETLVDVVVTNLDDDGDPIDGETATLEDAFTYARPDTGTQTPAMITAVTAAIVKLLRSEVLGNVVVDTHIDYAADEGPAPVVAETPAVILTGPDVTESRDFTLTARPVVEVEDPLIYWMRYRAPYYVDLRFDVAVITTSMAQLNNLITVIAQILHRNTFLEVPLAEGTGQYEIYVADGGSFTIQRNTAAERSNIRVAKGSFVIRGVNVLSIAGFENEGVVQVGGIVEDDPELNVRRYITEVVIEALEEESPDP